MSQRETILMTDDDEEDFLFLKEAFESLDMQYSLEHRTNGDDLIQYLSYLSGNGDKLPDLILLDINMPKMNGIEALQVLKQSDAFNKIPVFMYSTSNSPVQRLNCIAMGAVDFVTKGSVFQETLSFVNSLDMFLKAQNSGKPSVSDTHLS